MKEWSMLNAFYLAFKRRDFESELFWNRITLLLEFQKCFVAENTLLEFDTENVCYSALILSIHYLISIHIVNMLRKISDNIQKVYVQNIKR